MKKYVKLKKNEKKNVKNVIEYKKGATRLTSVLESCEKVDTRRRLHFKNKGTNKNYSANILARKGGPGG